MSDYLTERQNERDSRYTERKQQQMQTTSPPRPAKTHRSPAPPPTKRLITLAERQLSTVTTIASRLTASWPRVEAVAAALASPTLRAASPRDGGRSTDHPDPVASIAFDHEAYDELRDAVHAWLEQGKWIEHRSIAYLRDHPASVAAKVDSLKALCHEPGCDFDAVRRGLCWHHYERQLAAEKSSDLQCHTPTTPSATFPASGHPSALSEGDDLDSWSISETRGPGIASQVEATCGRCGWTTPAHDATHALQLLADHHTDGCPSAASA